MTHSKRCQIWPFPSGLHSLRLILNPGLQAAPRSEWVCKRKSFCYKTWHLGVVLIFAVYTKHSPLLELSMLKSLPPVFQNMTLFGNWIIADVISWAYTGVGWTFNPIRLVSLEEYGRKTQKKNVMWRWKKRLELAAANQRAPRISSNTRNEEKDMEQTLS